MWDTGATNSVITQQIAKKLKLLPIGKTFITGITGQKEVYTFMVDILLPNGLAIPDITVTECEKISANPGIEVLIGMDIIQLGDLAIANGLGQTIFTFAYLPFPKPTDLLDKANAVNPKK